MSAKYFDYIDYNHVWTTEPGNKDGAGESSYTTTCGLAVMSMKEFDQYKDKFGILDNIDNKRTDAWWTRSTRVGGSVNSVFVIGLNPNLLGNRQEWSVKGGTASRPVFWLKKSFFMENKLDLANTGENVIKALKQTYKAEELQNDKTGYLNHEMRNMGFTVRGINEIFGKEFFEAPEYIMDASNAGFTLTADITGSETLAYDVTYSVAEQEWKDRITVEPNKKFTKKFIFDKPKKGVADACVK